MIVIRDPDALPVIYNTELIFGRQVEIQIVKATIEILTSKNFTWSPASILMDLYHL